MALTPLPAAVCAAAILATLTTACSTDGCTQLRSAIPKAQLTLLDGRPLTLDSLQITGTGAPGNEPLVVAGTKVNEFYLPMDPTADTVQWIFDYKYPQTDLQPDTLDITYSRRPWFAGNECGAMYRYRILALTHTRHLINHITVTAPDSVITNNDAVGIRIAMDLDAPI